ncbi:MAG: sensor histidine kinase [Hamadaea sp.]|uniref:sensor histidine kinase n=1 Tax=Hamadaea sp. TaxID=2024425 RepID=UPI0017ED13DF|nr:sensor domain-containing protein [Hamadaea sp.]NUR73923.1 sensor histidine kinase [Hamadaea sp.]NUT19602.1 sensor histidine kinase [Hamadaea sp.]
MRIFRRLGSDAAYTLLSLPVAVITFALVVPFFWLGIGTLVIVLGFAVLAFTLLLARGFADLQRVRLQVWSGQKTPRPVYRKAPGNAGWFRKLTNPMRSGQSWLDLLHGFLNLPIAIFSFVLTVVWWAAALGGLTYWFWERYLPYPDDYSNPPVEALFGEYSRHNEILWNTYIGIFALLTVYFVQRFAAIAHASFAQLLLTRLAAIQGRIEDLTVSRAAAVSAEATALRKLERDIHDGPQQRLIRLAMELSRARRQLDNDPEAAAATIDDALGQAKETLDELRALSRGIAPPILADRGLGAALTTLASRSTVPVDVTLELDERLPAQVENVLYFTAAEALANVAKHSTATAARVTLTRRDARVYIMISDNGQGGAHPAKGHGLAGLADRLTTVDGEFAVDSPVGGPTVVIAEVPV